MAIVLEQQKRGTNWFAIIVFVFFLIVIVGGGYYLFFAPVPGIEIIAPLALETAAELSQLQLDPTALINNPVLKNLRQYGSLPGTGALGRENPFVSF